MSSHVAIVTDSTAYLPQEALTRHRITVVPLAVVIGDEALEEGTEVSAPAVARALQRRKPVTTSRPSPEEFAAAYRAVAESGATEIVSLHLSAEFSGTYDAALLAGADAPVPVRVVDTAMVAMALGFPVLSAAEAAEGAAPRTRSWRRRRSGRRTRRRTSTWTPWTTCAGADASARRRRCSGRRSR